MKVCLMILGALTFAPTKTLADNYPTSTHAGVSPIFSADSRGGSIGGQGTMTSDAGGPYGFDLHMTARFGAMKRLQDGSTTLVGGVGVLAGTATSGSPTSATKRRPFGISLGNRYFVDASAQSFILNALPLTLQNNTQKTSTDLIPAVGIINDIVNGYRTMLQAGAIVRHAHILDQSGRWLGVARVHLAGTKGGTGNKNDDNKRNAIDRRTWDWGFLAKTEASLSYKLGEKCIIGADLTIQDHGYKILERNNRTGRTTKDETLHNWGAEAATSIQYIF